MTNRPPDRPPAGPDATVSPERWEALARYLAGESPPGEVDEVRGWLAAAPGRQALVEALDRSFDRLAHRPPEDLDVEAALARVRARLDEPEAAPATGVLPLPPRPRRQEHPRPGRRSTILKIAAALVLFLGGAALWTSVRGPGDVPGGTFATGVGETESLRLADGTQVRLGPASRLTVPAGYGEPTRTVTLEGEALFEVVHDEARPFRVDAGAARVVDLGTTFAVRVDSEREVRVVVTEGTVLLQAEGTAATDGVVLRPGDRGLLGADLVPVPQRAAATPDDLAWTEGRLVFDEAPLPRVAADLFRWYGVHVRVADGSLAGRHLTATFQGEPAEEVFRVLELALGARVEMVADTAVLHASPGDGAPR